MASKLVSRSRTIDELLKTLNSPDVEELPAPGYEFSGGEDSDESKTEIEHDRIVREGTVDDE